MTDDLQEIDGVGPAREDNLNEAGYETYDDLAEADPEELADEIPRLPDDSALELVVQAQNLRDLEDAEVEEEDEEEGSQTQSEADDSEDEEDEDTDDVESEPEAEEEPEVATYEVSISLEGPTEYDTFYQTIIEQRNSLHRTNRAGQETYEKMLDELRAADAGDSVEVELEEQELNGLHNAVLQQRIEYQGDNLIDYMDALTRVEDRLNDVREQYLF